MTSLPLWSHLRILPTPTSDTFSILWTLTTSQFWRHFWVLPILSPFQQSPTLPHTPSTPTPHPTPPLRPLPPPKVTQRPLQTPHLLIWTPLWHSLETLLLSFTPWSQFKVFSILISNRGLGVIFRCARRIFWCGLFYLPIVLSSWSNLIFLLFKCHQIFLLFFFPLNTSLACRATSELQVKVWSELCSFNLSWFVNSYGLLVSSMFR